jgi:hypothetical protein
LFLWASFILSPVLLSGYEVVREPRKRKDKKIKKRKKRKKTRKGKRSPHDYYVVELGRCLAPLPILTPPLPTHTPLHSPTYIHSLSYHYIYSHSCLHSHSYMPSFPLLHVFLLLLHLTSYPHSRYLYLQTLKYHVFRRAFFPDRLGPGKILVS